MGCCPSVWQGAGTVCPALLLDRRRNDAGARSLLQQHRPASRNARGDAFLSFLRGGEANQEAMTSTWHRDGTKCPGTRGALQGERRREQRRELRDLALRRSRARWNRKAAAWSRWVEGTQVPTDGTQVSMEGTQIAMNGTQVSSDHGPFTAGLRVRRSPPICP